MDELLQKGILLFNSCEFSNAMKYWKRLGRTRSGPGGSSCKLSFTSPSVSIIASAQILQMHAVSSRRGYAN